MLKAGTGTPLLFVRHAETAWNREGRYQGRCDPPLSPQGEADAATLAARLAALSVCRLFSSPLQRALATASRLAVPLGMRVETDPRLSEIAFGAWEGHTQETVRQIWPEALRAWKRQPDRMRFPGGGETLQEARRRLLAFVAALPDASQPILLVTHTALIRIARLEAAGRPLADYRQIAVPPASVHALRLENGRLLPCCPDEGDAMQAAARPAPSLETCP